MRPESQTYESNDWERNNDNTANNSFGKTGAILVARVVLD